MPVVVKPTESAGSEGVKLCHSIEEAKDHFQLLMTSQRKVGSKDGAVLCQEFLRGDEYVIDHVSRDGVHKTVMLWVYDKRPANGASFVYYGMVPVEADSHVGRQLIPYVQGVLDALGIENGPSHGEVMMTETGPCLVEMNCRAHGGDAAWTPLARALTGGYCQVGVALDSFLDESAFQKLPKQPSPFLAAGQEVMLVAYSSGQIVSMPGFDKIRKMQSFASLETHCKLGSVIEPTIDLFGTLGSVILVHADAQIVKQDIEEVRRMENEGLLFELKDLDGLRHRSISEMSTK